MAICKQILGVQTQTTNVGVLLEMGKCPLCLSAVKLAVKNWERIRLGKGNGILIDSYKEGNLSWDSYMRTVLESNGMLDFYINQPQCDYPFIYKRIFERMIDNFHQTSFESIRGESSKLRTYALFKSEIGFEKYLTDVKKHFRSNLSDKI